MMSPFFENPQFIRAVHEERMRRLSQYSRPFRSSTRLRGRRRDRDRFDG